MDYKYVGLTLFGFAAPSAVIGVAYSIGTNVRLSVCFLLVLLCCCQNERACVYVHVCCVCICVYVCLWLC